MYSFSYLEPVCCSMSSSNCCFLACIQMSQEAGQVVWYSHHFLNFPQFIVIHTVKGFGIVNKAEIDTFLELSCFFDDPANAGNWSLAPLPFLKPAWTSGSSQLKYCWSPAWRILSITLLSPIVCSNSWPLSQWCYLTISSSAALFFCLQSFPAIGVFSNESALCITWPKYWSFSFSISPSNEYSGLISFRMDWFDLLPVQGTLKSLLWQHSSKASILQHSAFFYVQLSHP